VVILGGGFGGLHAARALRHAPVRVTLVDRRNHHLFQPLLYQVATATLNPSDIASPIRSMLREREPTRWPRATRMRLKGWKILSKLSNRPARNRPNEEGTMIATAKITNCSTMQEVLRARRRLAETA
jgi:glycine/D-amino acid oxidase-like deaminating enzyme